MSVDPVIELRELNDAEYALVPALFELLEPGLSSVLIVERVLLMRAQGWRCLGAFCNQELIAMAGYSTRIHLFSGPVMYVENLIVLPSWRAHQLGKRLMHWIEQYARESGCQKVTLDAYLSNPTARAFYERLGYDPRGVHFVLEIA